MPQEFDIEFCSPEYGDGELMSLKKALASGKLEGGGLYNKQCEALIKQTLSSHSVLMTPSCTASLEMMALVLDLKADDEVIMPDFTFVSTANAFALRGATPVFVDIDPNTLNIDLAAAALAITPKTKAIVAVHYAGVACDMGALLDLCESANIVLLEDAAQAYGAFYKDAPLGSLGSMGAFSFHHTKNISCGEGGAISVNVPDYASPIEWIQEKGTDRASFKRRETVKYEWTCLGSSYLLSELAAAVLSEQIKHSEQINAKRLKIWQQYANNLAGCSGLQLPSIPDYARHNAHIFHIRLPCQVLRTSLISELRNEGIVAASHYIPLHKTLGGRRYSKVSGTLQNTIEVSETLLRLPLHTKITDAQIELVTGRVIEFCDRHKLN